MARTTLSVRQLGRHIAGNATNPSSLRWLLNRHSGRVQLSVQFAPFSVMTHNMALLVAPGFYLGTDRDGSIAEIVAQIAALQPDVVGLCEMFADGEREFIRDRLRLIYPHFREGPDEFDLESDGGLLLLSRHPILFSRDIIYRDCDGSDCFATRGSFTCDFNHLLGLRRSTCSSPTCRTSKRPTVFEHCMHNSII